MPRYRAKTRDFAVRIEAKFHDDGSRKVKTLPEAGWFKGLDSVNVTSHLRGI
jgi:hypothetical protein